MSGAIQIVDQHGHPIRASDTAHFAASRRARELARWTPSLDSADIELAGEQQTIAARAYDLERNHGIAAGAIRTNLDNIVGTGLRLAAKPDYRALGRTKEWADEWAKNVEALWRTFSNSVDFDAGRQLNFGGMTVLQLRTAFLAGEGLALALWFDQRERPGARWSTAIQAIDPARLASPDMTPMTMSLRDGIRINSYGEPIGYYIRKSHPSEAGYGMGGDQGFEYVEARTAFGRRKVIHLFDKLRAGQSRGKSILAPVMAAFKMHDHYQRIELQTAVVNSMIAAFIETPLTGEQLQDLFGGTPDVNWQTAYQNSRAGYDVTLEGAGVIPLHPGDKLNAFTPNRPSTAYASFVEAVIRYIGTGVNMPYELVMKDFSKTNYAGARAALAEAWRYFMGRREWLATNWCDPVYELWLEEAISRGEVDAPDFYENRAAYLRCSWIGPGRGWIDPLKEAQASKTRMETTSTLEDEASEQGKDWVEILDQRARENEYARSRGLPDVHQPPPQGGAPGMQPAAEPAEDETETVPAGTQGGNQ